MKAPTMSSKLQKRADLRRLRAQSHSENPVERAATKYLLAQREEKEKSSR